MILFNSIVKHYYIGFGRNKDYVEGLLNNVKGYVSQRGKLELSYINSYGDKTVALGKVKTFGPLVFVKATAFGYTKWDEGITIATIGWKTKKHVYLATPIALNEILTVRIEHN